MPREARKRSKTSIYHVIFRGANRQEIFHDDHDRIRFLNALEKYALLYEMKCYAWCLMNNHIHLLLKEGNEEISLTLKRLAISFVQTYHFKYRTSGHLFEDRFKSENVETVKYLLTVVRYIHQNPLKARMVRSVDDWPWSSCTEYYRGYSKTKWLDCDYILKFYGHDRRLAIGQFREFNERITDDCCLEDVNDEIRRLTDDEARVLIKRSLGVVEIAQVKSLPKERRDPLIRELKRIKGISQRQMARILGVSQSLIFRA
ncbi:transposase [Bacillus sp. es.036]|uniref:transposase n=1 Tax=Bacillus sp. es.036 TaxID=1761764 RepID=UPI000BF383A9|nr:transposase [Bacillus sp. es.036]PFG15064.1 REP element-mobilizing transposase RayT [Bacillus sp. es.036]